MLAKEAIEQAERLRPGSMATGEGLAWLWALEARLMMEITHSDVPVRLSMEDELTAPDSYARLYPLWLVAQADAANAEYARYNNDVALFNEAYEAFAAWHTREHLTEAKWPVRGVK